MLDIWNLFIVLAGESTADSKCLNDVKWWNTLQFQDSKNRHRNPNRNRDRRRKGGEWDNEEEKEWEKNQIMS